MVRSTGDPAAEVRQRSTLLPLRLVIALAGICLLVLAGLVWVVFGRAPQTVIGKGILLPSSGYIEIGTKVVGVIDSVDVAPGYVVAADATIATVTDDSTDRRHAVKAPVSGVVMDVRARPGRRTTQGEPLALLSPLQSDLKVATFFPAGPAESLLPGMKALVSPSGAPPTQYGYIEGTVASISPAPAARPRVLSLLGDNELLSEYFLTGEPVTEVTVTMKPGDTPTGLSWTIGSGPDESLDGSTLATVQVVTRDGNVIDWMSP